MIKLMNYELYLWKLCMFYEINVYDLSQLIDESMCVYIYIYMFMKLVHKTLLTSRFAMNAFDGFLI